MYLILYGLFVAGVTIGLSILGLFIAHKFFNPDELKHNNVVADSLLQVTGTLYAVLLGLLVVHAMDRFQEARLNVENEAIAVADTFQLAAALPSGPREALQADCIAYAESVIEDEWEKMDDPEASQKAWELLDRIWNQVISFTPDTKREKFIYPLLLDASEQLNDCRRIRLVTCRTKVSPILWIVILTGAATIVIFTYVFGTHNRRGHMFMTAMCAMILSLNIFLWSIYSNPFYGLLKVAPEAFKMDLENFKYYMANPDSLRWHKIEDMKGKRGRNH